MLSDDIAEEIDAERRWEERGMRSYEEIVNGFAKELKNDGPEAQMRCDFKHAKGKWYRLMMRHLTPDEVANAIGQQPASPMERRAV